MSIDIISQRRLAADLQLIGNGGEISERAVAGLLRAPLARWGLSPRYAVLRYAREQLEAAGVGDAAVVARVLDRLIALGECEDVFVGHERYLAPAEPRWMSAGGGVGVYLSPTALPDGVSLVAMLSEREITRRINVGSDDDAAALQVAGVREVSIEEWLTPPGYLRHAARRLGRPTRSDAVTLRRFWEVLTDALATEGLLLSADALVRAVTGAPGDYFGRHDASEPEGRWTEEPADGLWCAYRRGYSDAHWHPTVLAVDGSERRALDLYDADEWRWALLARGRNMNSDEVVQAAEGTLRVTFPAPSQMRAAMDLLGVQTGPWAWGWPTGAPDLWAFVR